ncbi:MAG: choice-of-anchor N protein [Pirellulaceae bacterium]
MAIVVIASAQRSYAVPILQIYLEGGTYDSVTESWVVTPTGSSGGEPFRLWTIGNVAGPGGKGTISNVRLSISYSAADLGLELTLTPSTTGGFNGVLDLSTSPIVAPRTNSVLTSSGTVGLTGDGNDLGTDYAVSPNGNIVVLNGGTPVLGDGKPLPSHGVFGDGVVWQEFGLGDFDKTDSPIGDYIGSFPTTMTADAGQINVYEVSVTGCSGATIHFDLYNSVGAKNHAKFAPFSHDADGEANIVPEPASCIVWAVLALGSIVGATRRSRRQRKTGSGLDL